MRDLGSEVQPAVSLATLRNRWEMLDAKEQRTLAEIRLEKGRILVEARKAWAPRGPSRVDGMTWSEWLALPGIRLTTDRALDYMKYAGYVEVSGNFPETSPAELPTYAEAGIKTAPPPTEDAIDDEVEILDTEDAAETRAWEPPAALPAVAVAIPHVAHNSGNNEWYTPAAYIEAARKVLGAIDLDPASSDTANNVVKACIYHTAESDGLSKIWAGRVWMNPPYASDLVGRFAEKLAKHFDDGEVTAAIVLVNNATETAWFATLVSRASAVVFPRGRVRFWEPDGKAGAPLQGQAILYLGANPGDFLDGFDEFGWGALVQVSDAA